jgi:hypothetical protein
MVEVFRLSGMIEARVEIRLPRTGTEIQPHRGEPLGREGLGSLNHIRALGKPLQAMEEEDQGFSGIRIGAEVQIQEVTVGGVDPLPDHGEGARTAEILACQRLQMAPGEPPGGAKRGYGELGFVQGCRPRWFSWIVM